MADETAAERTDANPESPDQPDPNTMPLDELAALIARDGIPSLDHDAITEDSAPEPEPEPEPAPVAEPAPVDPPSEAVLRETQLQLEREQWKARYEKLEQHAGRLAGEIGHLKKTIGRESGYEPAPDVPEDRASELTRRLDEMERRSNQEAATRAIAEEFSAIGNRPELAALNLKDEIAEATQRYGDKWQDILKIEEPSQARIAAKEMAVGILMDAIGLRIAKKPVPAVANETRVVERKLAVSASGATGARVGVRPKPPDPNTMPLDDLKAWIERMGAAE